MTRLLWLLAFGFWVQASTLPQYQSTAWSFFGPFDTLVECQAINAAVHYTGTYAQIDPCEVD